MDKKYDVGVVGCWYWGNYGSLLNGYATYHILSSFGLKVLNIVTPNNGFEPHAAKFFKTAYPENAISDVLPFERIHEYNARSDVFLSGSDQIWNNASTLPYNEFFRLAFTGKDKRRISFATSFGNSIAPPDETTKNIYARLLQRYNAVSVREDTGVQICMEQYGVKATQLLEPVLDVDIAVWEELAEHSDYRDDKEPYLLSYILDPTPEKNRAIQYYAQKLGVKTVNILDGFSGRYAANRAKLGLAGTLPNINCCDFLKFFSRASFIISDSFHGTAFALAFNKPFISITNKKRGIDRFRTLLGKLDLMERLVDEQAIPLNDKYLYYFDYSRANKIIGEERKRAVAWLKNAVLTKEKQSAALPKNIAARLPEELCVGCGSCVSSCPTQALGLRADRYGYYRVKINAEKCIDCGICMQKCPARELPRNLNAKNPLSYAFICKNKKMLFNSASGGAFPVFARETIRRGGVAVGATWTENFKVKHILVEKEEDIVKLQKSKYLQSYMGTTFKEVKNKLNEGRFVLFSGCPCQVAGLKKYLGKNYANLITVDLFCAICPSQWFFEKYIAEKFGDDLEFFQFRAKSESDKIWDAYTYSVTLKNAKENRVRMKDDDYYKNPLLLTPSHCKKCKYQGTTRVGDLSLGDCWGIQNYDADIDVARGVSAILVNNEKGEEFLNSIPKKDIEVLKPEPLEEIKKYNVCAFQENRNWPVNKKRELFYREITETDFMEAINDALKE